MLLAKPQGTYAYMESIAYPLYTLHTNVTTVRKDHMPTGEILAY
jgi:hypothetical protein